MRIPDSPVTRPDARPGDPDARDAPGELPDHVRAVSRRLPAIGSHLSPVHNAKHMRMTELGNGRIYIVAGDWGGGGDGYSPSGRQETYSYDILTDDWLMAAPYCSPDGRYPFHPDEVGQMWDPKRQVMWLGPGVIYPYDDTCNMGGGLPAALATFDPATRTWSRSKTLPPLPMQMQNTPRPPTNGIYDQVTDQLWFIGDAHVHSFDPTTETWTTYPHAAGRFSDGYVAQIGRHIYIIDEKPYTLYRWDIDTHVFERLADLPDDMRDGNGDDHGRVYMAALGGQLALYQEINRDLQVKSLLSVYDTETATFRRVIWDDATFVKGNTMTWHSSGWMVLFGCTGSGGCSEANPMQHIHLVDLREFGGTGEDLEKVQ